MTPPGSCGLPWAKLLADELMVIASPTLRIIVLFHEKKLELATLRADMFEMHCVMGDEGHVRLTDEVWPDQI